MSKRKANEMRAGDWLCPNCEDHQFAKNTHCRKCNTVKPGEEGVSSTSVAELKRAKVTNEANWDKTKLCVFGLNKFATRFSFSNFLDNKKLEYKKILKLKNQTYALVSFSDEDAASKVLV